MATLFTENSLFSSTGNPKSSVSENSSSISDNQIQWFKQVLVNELYQLGFNYGGSFLPQLYSRYIARYLSTSDLICHAHYGDQAKKLAIWFKDYVNQNSIDVSRCFVIIQRIETDVDYNFIVRFVFDEPVKLQQGL